MKRSVIIIIGIALVLLIEGVVAVCVYHHYAHQGMRGAIYAMQINRPGMARGRDRNANFPGIRGMWPGIGPGAGFGMRPGMVPEQRFGMRPGMGTGPINRMGQWPMGPGRSLGNIPDLTEKQKKDIADLRQKLQDEMKKLRDEMSAKVKSLGDSQRNKILDLLTPEQKKFLDSNSGNANK